MTTVSEIIYFLKEKEETGYIYSVYRGDLTRQENVLSKRKTKMVNTTCNNYVVSLCLITPNAPIIVELNELILGFKGSRAKRETTTCRLRKEKKRKKKSSKQKDIV